MASLVIVSCNSDDEAVVDPNSTDGTPLTAGSADFSKYVALGDSFAAGFSDNALFAEGQKNAYPNIIATQFALVGGGEFTTPFMADNIGGFSSGGVQIPQFGPRLWFNAATSTPLPVSGVSATDISTHLSGSFNNMGLPGAKATHLGVAGYGAANPYFGRIASGAGASVVGDAIAQNPTFFSLWIGGNDVLGYATSGGDGSNPITPPATFNTAYGALASQLSAGGRKGVVANLPYINTLPFFTTVPYNPLTTSVLGQGNVAVGEATINALNAQLYGPLDAIFTALGEPNRINPLSATAANPILINDADATDRSAQITGALTPTLGATTAAAFGAVFGKARQATSADLVVLPASSVIGTTNSAAPAGINKNGVTFPMANKWVLTATEKARVAAATTAYNNSIIAIAATKNLAVADMNAVMNQLVSGLQVETNSIYTANYFSGSGTEGQVLFSLDGVHPNARGYAVIANEIIKTINAKFKSNLPLHNPTYFPGISILPTN